MQPDSGPLHSRSTRKPENYYQTPWEKKEQGGERSCIEVSYDMATKTVVVKELTQTRLNRFAAFMLGTKANDWYAHTRVNVKREFQNIALNDFDAEKETLIRLVKDKTSLEELIMQIEIQLAPPAKPVRLLPDRPPVPRKSLPNLPGQPAAALPIENESEERSSISDKEGQDSSLHSEEEKEDEAPSAHRDSGGFNTSTDLHERDGTGESELPQPTLSPDQLHERQEKLAKLRAELEKINQEIEATDFQPLTKIHSAIGRIKGAVDRSFTALNDLQSKIEELGDNVDRKIQNLSDITKVDVLSNFVHQAREIVVQEMVLEQQADKFTRSVESLPEEIKQKWDEFIADWKKKAKEIGPTKIEQIEERRNQLETGMKKITSDFLEYAKDIAEGHKAKLQSNAEDAGIDPDMEIAGATPFATFQLTLVKQRLEAWDKLIQDYNNIANDLEALKAKQNEIDGLVAGDKVILKLVIPKEKGILENLFGNLLSYPTALIFDTSETLTTKLTDTEDFYTGKIIECIDTLRRKIGHVLEAMHGLDDDDYAEAQKRLQEVFDPTTVNLMGIENYIKATGEIVAEYLEKNEDSQNNLTFVQNTWQEMFSIASALPILVEAERKVKNDIIADIKKANEYVFSDANNPQLKALAERALHQIEERSGEGSDLSSYYSRKRNFKFFADQQTQFLTAAVSATEVYKKYDEIAKAYAIETATFTGPEREDGESALESLKMILKNLTLLSGEPLDLTLCGDKYITDEFTRDLDNTLKIATEEFERVKAVEQKKIKIRKEISKRVNDYNADLKNKIEALDALEKSLGITVTDVKKGIQDSQKTLKGKIANGKFSNVLFTQAPFQRIGQLTYFFERKPQGEFDVGELSITNLNDYLKQIKNDIEVEKQILEQSLPFAEINDLLELNTQKIDAAELRVSELKKDFTVKIPARRSLERLQFANASVLEAAVNKVKKDWTTFLENRVKTNALALEDTYGKPTLSLAESELNHNSLKAIINELKIYNKTLSDLIKKSERTETLSLLQQIKLLEHDQSNQLAAKKAYLEMQRATMDAHATTAKTTIDSLQGHIDIHQEAKKLLQRSQNEFSKRLGTSPLAQHAARLHAPTLMPDESKVIVALSLEDISFDQFQTFENELNKIVSKDESELSRLRIIEESATRSENRLKAIIQEAEDQIEQLDSSDELIKKLQLEAELEKIKKEIPTAKTTQATNQTGWFAWWKGKQAPVEIYGPSAALEKLTAAHGHKISRITAAYRQANAPLLDAKKKSVVSLEEQLNYVTPTHVAFQPLLDRLILRSHEMLFDKKKQLDAFTARAETVLKGKLPIEQNITSKIKADVNVRKNKLSELDKEFEVTKRWFGFETGKATMKVSKLQDIERVATLEDRDYAIQYHKKVEEAVKAATEFEKSYKIDEFNTVFKEYIEAKNKIENEVEFYKKDGFYEHAYSLESYYKKIISLIDPRFQNKKIVARELLELGTKLQQTTKPLLLEKSKVVAEEIAKRRRYKAKTPMELQLVTFSDLLKKLPVVDLPLVETYIQTMKTAIGERIRSEYDEHKNFLHSLIEKRDGKPDVINQLCEKYKLSDNLNNDAHKAVRTESQNFNEESPKISVGRRWIVFKNEKTVENMRIDELIKSQPLITIEASIKASQNAIDGAVDIKGLQKADIAFDAVLKSSKDQLVKFDEEEAFSKSAEAAILIAKMEAQIKDYIEANKGNQNVEQLIQLINDTVTKLKKGIEEIRSKPTESIVDQIGEIQRIEPGSPHLKTLRDSLAKEIHKKVEKYKSEIDTILSLEATPVDKGGFLDRFNPKKAKSGKVGPVAALSKELNAPAKWVEEFVSVIKDSLQSYDNLLDPQLIAGKKVEFFKLSADELIKLSNKIDAVARENATILQGLNVGQVHSDLKAYRNELKECLDQKQLWNRLWRSDGAKAIGAVIEQVNQNLKNYFSEELTDDPKVIIKSLRKLLQVQKQTLSSGLRDIRRRMPESQGIAIQSIQENSEEYSKMKAAILAIAGQQLEQQMDSLDSYLNPLQSIDETLQSLFEDDVLISDIWRNQATEYIERNRNDVDFLRTTFRVPNNNVQNVVTMKDVSLDQLTKEQLLEYEILVNKLVGTEKKGKVSGIPDLDTNIEQRLNLQQIDKALRAYAVAVNDVKDAVRKSDVPKEKKILQVALKCALKAHNRLVSNAIKRMTCLSDSQTLLDTLKLAQAVLDRNVKLYHRSAPLELDPWSQILYDEKEKSQLTPKSVNQIFEAGFKLDIPATSHVTHPSILEIRGIDQLIGDAVNNLNYLKNIFQRTADYMLSLGIPPADSMIEIMTKFAAQDIPNEIAKLELLIKGGIYSRLPDGSEEYLSRDQMKTFDQIAKYKMYVIANINQSLDLFERELDQLPIYSKYLKQTHQRPQAKPADGLAAPKQNQPASKHFPPHAHVPGGPPAPVRAATPPLRAATPPPLDPDEGKLRVRAVQPAIKIVEATNENLQIVREYLNAIDGLLPENAQLNRFRQQTNDSLNAVPADPNEALKYSAALIKIVQDTEKLTQPIVAAMNWLSGNKIDYKQFASVRLGELNQVLENLDPRVQTVLNDLYSSFIPTKDIDFVNARVSAIAEHFNRMGFSARIITIVKELAPLFAQLYPVMDELEKLPQNRALQHSIALLKTELADLLMTNAINELDGKPAKLSALLRKANDIYHQHKKFASSVAAQPILVAQAPDQPAVIGKHPAKRGWQYDINNQLDVIKKAITELQKDRGDDLMSLSIDDIKKLDGKNNNLKKQISDALNQLNIINTLTPQLYKSFQDGISDKDETVREFLNNICSAHVSFQKWNIQETALKDIFDYCSKLLEFPAIRDKLIAFGVRLQPSMDKLRILNGELPTKDIQELQDKFRNYSAENDVSDLDQVNVFIDQFVRKAAEVSQKVEQIIGYIKSFQPFEFNPKALMVERFDTFKQLVTEQFPTLSVRWIDYLRSLIPASEIEFSGRTIAENELSIAEMRHTINLFEKVEQNLEPVTQIDSSLKAFKNGAPEILAINNIYDRLATSLEVALTPKSNAGLEQLPDILTRLQTQIAAELEKWKSVFAGKQKYDRYVVEFDEEIAFWRTNNRLDVVHQLRQLHETTIKLRKQYFDYPNTTDPVAIAKRFDDDIDKLKDGKDKIIISVDPQADPTPPSNSPQFVEYRQNVIDEVKAKVVNLRKMIDVITTNIPSDNASHNKRDAYIKKINNTVDQLGKDEVYVKRFQIRLSPSVKKLLQELDKDQLKQFQSAFELSYNAVVNELREIQLAAQTVVDNKDYLADETKLDERYEICLNALHARSRVEGNYFNFYLADLLDKGKDQLDQARKAFVSDINRNTDFNDVIAKGKIFKSALERYNIFLEEAKQPGIHPDIIDQLRLEQSTPGILTPASKAAIIEGLKTHTDELVAENINSLHAHFEDILNFPVVEAYVKTRITETIEGINNEIGDIDAIINKLDPDVIAPIWGKIQTLYKTRAFSLKRQMKQEQIVDALLNVSAIKLEVENKLNEYRSRNLFWIAADLNHTYSELTKELTGLEKINKQEDFDKYFSALQTFNRKLNTHLDSFEAEERKPKDLNEQMVYLATKYPDTYTRMKEYELLKKALITKRNKP